MRNCLNHWNRRKQYAAFRKWNNFALEHKQKEIENEIARKALEIRQVKDETTQLEKENEA